MAGPFRTARTALTFTLNMLAAALGPGVIEVPLVRYFAPLWKGSSMAVPRVEAMAAAAGFAVGYFVYRRWRPTAAKWVWVAAARWLVGRLFWRAAEGGDVLHDMLLGPSPTAATEHGYLDWIRFTIPSIRVNVLLARGSMLL